MKKITISNEKERLDINFIYQFLTQSYWAKGRSLSDVKQSIENSMCYGVYIDDRQVGFARVLSDKVVFAYIMDVFIIEKERGKGFANDLMEFILNDQALEKVDQWYLKTKDAHTFYKKHGFEKLENPDWFMEMIKSNHLQKEILNL